MVGRSDLLLTLLNGAVKSMGTDNSRGGDFSGATGGGKRGSWRFDSYSTRADTDVGCYLIPPICPVIKVQKYEHDTITSQLDGTECIKTRLNIYSNILQHCVVCHFPHWCLL